MGKKSREKKTIYKLSESELIRLTQAMHNPTLVDRRGQPLQSAQERCLSVWKDIAESRGLDVNSIGPAPGKGADYFTAEKLPQN